MSLPIRTGPMAQSRARITGNLSKLRGEIAKTTYSATTGLAFDRPSEAPDIWSNVHALGEQLNDQETWEKNAKQAGALLNIADDSLGEGTRVMRDARALAVRMANGSMSADDRIEAAGQVDAMRETMRTLGNTKLGDRFIFAGNAYDTQPFDAAGVYQGSIDVPTTLLAADESVQIGSDGSDVFGGALQALEDLSIALQTGDQSNIQSTLTAVDSGMSRLIRERVDVGGRQREALDTEALTETLRLSLETALDDQLAADPVETYQRLVELQTTYEANIAVTASSQRLRGLMQTL